MQYVNEIMSRTPRTIAPEAWVQTLAQLLLDSGVEGVCVVDEDDKLVGVVTAMDLFVREKRVQMPPYNLFTRMVVSLARPGMRTELAKSTGVTVGDIMSKDPVTMPFDATLEDLAPAMVEGHYTVIPVVKDGVLLGVVNTRDVVRTIVERFHHVDSA
ncbi:MAG: CBS domain-containing protein [Proteobacteria bacterium]|nr:CBS domain-containing protein [Pseudomonadota bacterium]MCP4922102.1 CBS domain-containing protein [Pseudomonadota bacterium]